MKTVAKGGSVGLKVCEVGRGILFIHKISHKIYKLIRCDTGATA